MMDDLEIEIRNLWCNSGGIDEYQLIDILLQLLYRVQKLEESIAATGDQQ